MIISRKRLNEKIREALDQADRERWTQEKIDRIEREIHERMDGISRHLFELDRKIGELTDHKTICGEQHGKKIP